MENLTLETIENLPIEIKLVGETIRDNNWVSDQWRVTIGKFNFDYFTGLGHRKNNRPVRPKKASVLHALIMDSSTSQLNFNDWCDEYGYSRDSISALNTYRACLDISEKLKQCFSREILTQIVELVQEY